MSEAVRIVKAQEPELIIDGEMQADTAVVPEILTGKYPFSTLQERANVLVFPDLNSSPFGGEDFQTNLIMPEPTKFLSKKLPACSIVRPTATKGAAMGALKFLTEMGLFIGQSPKFFELMRDLAEDADDARRGH